LGAEDELSAEENESFSVPWALKQIDSLARESCLSIRFVEQEKLALTNEFVVGVVGLLGEYMEPNGAFIELVG